MSQILVIWAVVLCIKMALVDTGYETLMCIHWFRKQLCGKADNAPPPKDGHILTPRNYEYVTQHGKRDFADVIKVMDLEMGDDSGGLIVIMSPEKQRIFIAAVRERYHEGRRVRYL